MRSYLIHYQWLMSRRAGIGGTTFSFGQTDIQLLDHQNVLIQGCCTCYREEKKKKKRGSRRKSRPLCLSALKEDWHCTGGCSRAHWLNVARAIMLNDLHTRFPQTKGRKEKHNMVGRSSSQHQSVQVLKHGPSRSFPSFSFLSDISS